MSDPFIVVDPHRNDPERGMGLYRIDETIAQLIQLREDPATTEEERAAIDGELKLYAEEQMPAKVDGYRGYIKLCRMNQQAAKEEKAIAFDAERMWASRAERMEEILKEVMERRGVKRLDGKIGHISLKGNGGLAPMEPVNESILPDEYRSISFTLPLPAWYKLQKLLEMTDQGGMLRFMLMSAKAASVNMASVRAALEAGEDVPGARLAERGKHIEVK